MRRDISEEDSRIILRKLCEMVGVILETINFSDPNWYELHTWSPEEEQEFINWLADFLVKHNYARKGGAFREAQKINMQYGWKTV